MDKYDCEFKVWRNRKSTKIFTVSLWKSSIGYVFNLSNSLIWWANNFPTLFPDWNIRIYFDKSIYTSLKGEDKTEWRELIDRLKKYNHIELWEYNCLWGKESFHKPHIGTFGSLVRFHAFDDPELEVIVCHNLEYLTSPRDRDCVLKWIDTGKKYNWYCFWNERGQYGVMIPKKIDDIHGLAATFGIQKRVGESEDILFRSIELVKKYDVRDFRYGVDELVLTALVKPKMTRENTFITDMMYDIEQLNVLFPKYMSMTLVYEFMEEEVYDEYVREVGEEVDYTFFYNFVSEDAILGAEFVKFVKSDLKRRRARFIPEIIDRFHNFLFDNLFLKEIAKINVFFKNLETIYNPRDILLSLLETSIINCIDFPGFCVKNKNFGRLDRKVSRTESKSIKTVYNLKI